MKMGDGNVNLNKVTRLNNLLGRASRDYLNLVMDPFNAEWVGVGNTLFNDSFGRWCQTFRCEGIISHVVPAGDICSISFMPNPGSPYSNNTTQVSNVYALASLDAGVGKQTSTVMGIPGCPPYQVANASYQGNAGYVQNTSSVSDFLTFVTGFKSITSSVTQLSWGTQPIKDAVASAPAEFQYRPLAGELKIFPTDKNTDLRGVVASALIPENNNIGLGDSETPFVSQDAHIQRADKEFSLLWIPSKEDINFYSPVEGLASANGNSDVVFYGCRANLQINAISSTDTYGIEIVFVVFYEVSGQCVAQTGKYRNANPEDGAVVGDAMQKYMYQANSDEAGFRKPEDVFVDKKNSSKKDRVDLVPHVQARAIENMPAVEAKANPAKMDKPSSKGGFFSTLWDIGKMVLPELIPLLL